MHALIQEQKKENKNEYTSQRDNVTPKSKSRSNQTGLPYGLQSRFEEKYGVSFEDVRVHYNSKEPAKLNALAYTQGTDVYIAPHQEKHLNHELGHVIQQKCRSVPKTRTVNGHPVNDDLALERQADQIGSFCSDIYSGAPMDADGEVAQLTTGIVEYQVIDGSGKKVGNATIYKGDTVTVGKGKPGKSHAEQNVWGKARDDIIKKIEPGKRVEILFMVDEVICGACREWFENVVYSELMGAAHDNNSLFTLIVQVTTQRSQTPHRVTLKGSDTKWPGEVTDNPPDRLSEHDRGMMRLGVDLNQMEMFSVGGQNLKTVREAIMAADRCGFVSSKGKFPNELEQLFQDTKMRANKELNKSNQPGQKNSENSMPEFLVKMELCDMLNMIENDRWLKGAFMMALNVNGGQTNWKRDIGNIFFDVMMRQ